MAHHQPLRSSNRRISFCPNGDGWQAVLQSGIQVQGHVDAATKAEAIAAALAFAEKFPDAELAPLHLGCVKAWFTPDGWRYTQSEGPPYAKYAHLYDEYGVTVLHIGLARITDACEA